MMEKKSKYLWIIAAVLAWIGLLALVGTGMAGKTTPADESGDRGGAAVTMGNITVLNLNGTWYEMGRQYGELAKEQLNEVLAFCEDMIGAKTGNADQAADIVGRQAEQMPYTIREFFRGAGETSGLTTEQLYVTNAVERIAGLPHCSVAAVWGDYAKDKMVVGRNYDYGEIFAQLHDDVLVTVFNPADDALSTAIVGYAGEIYAVNGMNEAGLFLELNNGKPSAPMSSPDERITGTTLLLDVLFEADNFAFLDRYFNTVKCSSSYIINVLDGSSARSYEWCPVGVKHGEDYNPDGLLISTNHYINPDWETEPPTDESSWESLTRRENLIALCEKDKGNIDAERMKQIVTTPLEEGGAQNEMTVYQLVALPADGLLWVKTVDSESWAEIDLNSFWG